MAIVSIQGQAGVGYRQLDGKIALQDASANSLSALDGSSVKIAADVKINILDLRKWHAILVQNSGKVSMYIDKLEAKLKAQNTAQKIAGVVLLVILGGVLPASTYAGTSVGSTYFGTWCVLSLCFLIGVVVTKRKIYSDLESYKSLQKSILAAMQIFSSSDAVKVVYVTNWISSKYVGRKELTYGEMMAGYIAYNVNQEEQRLLHKKAARQLEKEQKKIEKQEHKIAKHQAKRQLENLALRGIP